ncbi:DUF4850 domain-containing protein [Paenibacillus piri]|uniref:DUF4850 domain-containing protein n=1 Tax=Paenibacillus piri TaxID=2547395 RepID=UPI0014050557|nr:DUF4850 domain-containing protein [Paenibacillus piri]
MTDTRNDKLQQDQRQTTACGKLGFGKEGQAAEIELPLNCIAASYGADDPDNPTTVTPKTPLNTVPYSIPSELRGKLAAYWMNLGDNVRGVLLLAPADWKITSAAVGANGSSGIRLENPKDPGQYISYMDNGGCQGCVIANIGAYFPKLKGWAEQQGFTSEPVPEINKQTLLHPNLMAFSKKTPVQGYAVNGVAYQKHGGGGGIFRMQEVQLPDSEHRLAQVILNLFVALNRAGSDVS